MALEVLRDLRCQDLGGVLRRMRQLVFRYRLCCCSMCQKLLRDKQGLEIGGPSEIFGSNGLLPVYSIVASIDNCNYGYETVWEGEITEGKHFQFDKRKPPGMQYVCEASDLSSIPSAHYDFILSSHTIEHTANPLKAIIEWIRVLKENGKLVLVVPHKDGTFDHRRPVTLMEHLIEDYENRIPETDLSHLGEILTLHDLSMDPPAGDLVSFRARSERNYENRCLHHHVFDSKTVAQMLDYLRIQIRTIEAALPYHIFAIAEKPKASLRPQNEVFLSSSADFLRKSPFPSDCPTKHSRKQ